MDQANILIIGGGVIGCAIARAVSSRWQDVYLVERFPKPGMATSTRNSGVNHSGIYYPKNSLKAKLCVEGNRLTYEFCANHNVPFRHCGKLVVAADAHEEPELLALKLRACWAIIPGRFIPCAVNTAKCAARALRSSTISFIRYRTATG